MSLILLFFSRHRIVEHICFICLYILLNFERDLLADCLLQRKLIVATNVAKRKNTNVQPMGSSEFQSSLNSCITSQEKTHYK